MRTPKGGGVESSKAETSATHSLTRICRLRAEEYCASTKTRYLQTSNRIVCRESSALDGKTQGMNGRCAQCSQTCFVFYLLEWWALRCAASCFISPPHPSSAVIHLIPPSCGISPCATPVDPLLFVPQRSLSLASPLYRHFRTTAPTSPSSNEPRPSDNYIVHLLITTPVIVKNPPPPIEEGKCWLICTPWDQHKGLIDQRVRVRVRNAKGYLPPSTALCTGTLFLGLAQQGA